MLKELELSHGVKIREPKLKVSGKILDFREKCLNLDEQFGFLLQKAENFKLKKIKFS